MGNCGTCCIGRGKEVGMADDGRCVVHSLCWNKLTTTWDRGLRCKPSCFQHQMIFEKCLKLVGRKWFPFRRFFINGWTVHCFESDECTPTFSLFLYWQDPFTLPCVTACEANTTLYFVSAFVLHLIPFVKLCWPLYKPYQAFLGLPLGEAQGFPIWPFKSVKDVQNVRPGCQPKLAIAQGEPASGQRCLRGRGFSSVWCMRCRMDLERISCSAAEVRRLPSLHSDEFCPFVELSWFMTQYSSIFGLNNKCTRHYILFHII